MLEKIAMWGGVAGIVVALVAIIIMFLTRQNILDILDKDVILFDKNFELKKQAIERAMLMIDELEEKGSQIKMNLEFAENAKRTYNELLCVVSDVRVADEFYSLSVDKTVMPTSSQYAHFKLVCRHDIGLSNKKAKLLKRVKTNNVETDMPEMPEMPTSTFGGSYDTPRATNYAPTQPVNRPVQQSQSMQSARVQAQPQPRPMQQARPMQPNPSMGANPVQRPMPPRSTQPRDNA